MKLKYIFVFFFFFINTDIQSLNAPEENQEIECTYEAEQNPLFTKKPLCAEDFFSEEDFNFYLQCENTMGF